MTTSHPTPESILPDNKNTATIKGITIRKGTIAAILANIDLIESKYATPQEKEAGFRLIKELAPGAIAIGLHKHLSFRNPEIESIFQS